MFDIVGRKVTISANALAIPCFKKLWESSKDIETAEKEITYIVLLHKPSSPYRNYVSSIRESIVKKDVFGNPEHLISEDAIYCEERYLEFINTLSLRLLEGAEVGAEAVTEYFMSLKNNPISGSDAKNIMSTLASLAASIKSIENLRDAVKRDQLSTSRVQGGSEIGDFELPGGKFK